MYKQSDLIRCTLSVAVGGLWALAGPLLPFAGVCTALAFAAALAERRLKGLPGNLLKIYAVLVMAQMVQAVILDGMPVNCVKFVAGAICFWQAWAMLEAEAARSKALWARVVQRLLVDKVEQHLGVDLKELHRNDRDPIS